MAYCGKCGGYTAGADSTCTCYDGPAGNRWTQLPSAASAAAPAPAKKFVPRKMEVTLEFAMWVQAKFDMLVQDHLRMAELKRKW